MNKSEISIDNEQADTQTGVLDRPLILFFVLAYAIAWGTLAVLGLIARQSGIDNAVTLMQMGESLQFEGASLSVPQWLVYLLTRLADFSFSISGIMMIAVTAGRTGLKELWQRLTHWRIGWLWLLAGLLPLLLYGLATAVSGELGSFNFSGETLFTILFSANAGLLVSLFLRGAFGEEFGLRGFALPRMQGRMSSFRASLIIGVLWALWHLPVLLGRDALSIIAFILLAIGLSFYFTWLFNGSGGSLIPVLLFHAIQNWEEGFETVFPGLVETSWDLVSLIGLLVIGIVAAVVLWRNGRNNTAKD